MNDKKTALVTGASGFTGGYMVDHLLEQGYSVRAFVRPTSNIDDLKEKNVDIVMGFLESAESVEKAAKGVDIIYHIAALYREANRPDWAYHEVNVKGTENVLNAALKNNARVLHCSTAGVHGHVEDPPGNENSPFNPGDIYQQTKLKGEQKALAFHKETGLPVTIVRPIGIYGPGDTRMLKMYKLVKNKKFIMFGSGRVYYHLTYVSDVVEGFRLAAESEKSNGEIYIIGGKEYTTLSEFAATIADVLSVPRPKLRLPVWPLYGVGWMCEKLCIPLRIQPPIFRRRVDIFVKDRAFDISKAQTELNFNPRISMKEGIRRTAEWYRQKDLL